MNRTLAITAAAVLSTAAVGQSTNASPLARTRTAFDLVVPLPYAQAAPLFGPEGERGWAGKHWNPQFLYPQPAHDEQGAVFTVQHGPVTATWVNSLFDLEARHFIYTYFVPGIMVTTVDVTFAPADAGTKVHVTYTRTSLTPEGNHHVATFTASDKTAARDWQQAIDTFLATRKP